MRFSSEKTRRIAAVEKMSRNTAESIKDEGMDECLQAASSVIIREGG